MVDLGADQHEGRIAVRESLHCTGVVADLTVEPLNHNVSSYSGPVLIGKIKVGQRFLKAIIP